jgi:hypothetical protein
VFCKWLIPTSSAKTIAIWPSGRHSPREYGVGLPFHSSKRRTFEAMWTFLTLENPKIYQHNSAFVQHMSAPACILDGYRSLDNPGNADRSISRNPSMLDYVSFCGMIMKLSCHSLRGPQLGLFGNDSY